MPTVYVTAPPAAAEDIAHELVEDRLAACVNLVDCASIYRWDDGVVTDDEAVLLAKTTDEGVGPLADRVRELHPYDVPCIERFEDEPLDVAFEEWRAESVGQ